MLLGIVASAALVVQDARAAPLIGRDREVAPPPVSGPPAPAAPASLSATGTGAPIRAIRFTGVDAPRRIARAARAFLGQPANEAVLTALAATLSARYAETDAGLYTIDIPAQDFADGVVEVRITEGRLTAASLRTDDPSAHPLLRARLGRLLEEAPLSRSTLEREFALIRETPGLTVEPQFAPGIAPGTATLVVTPRQRRTRFSLGYSSRGIDLLGTGQFDARAEGYGLATDGDQLTLSLAAADDLRRFRYAAGSYLLPLGSNGFAVTTSAAWLETRPDDLPIRGTARQAGVTLAYPWRRAARSQGDVSIGFDGVDSDNAVLGNVIATERLRTLRAAGSYGFTGRNRAVSVAGVLAQGIDGVGARIDPLAGEAGFTKLQASAGATQAIGRRAALRLTISGQYSGDALPAAERYTAGGATIGRAFDQGILTGDRGLGAVGELAFRPLRSGGLANSELYLFADSAWIGVEPRGPLAGGDASLASAGFGARGRLRDKAELGLEAAWTIDRPFPGYAEDFRVSVEWRLTL